jgi:hypothetical protein
MLRRVNSGRRGGGSRPGLVGLRDCRTGGVGMSRNSIEILFRDATVIDGSGTAGYRADVAVAAGRIAAIGQGLRAGSGCDRRGRQGAGAGLHRCPHARRHPRDPRAGDGSQDHPGRDDGDRRQLRDQRLPGADPRRGARPDEPAGRTGAFYLPRAWRSTMRPSWRRAPR